MNNKKFSQWLHRLLVLLIAFFLAVSPLMMSVSSFAADRDVLSGLNPPEYDGYQFLYSIVTYPQPGVAMDLRFYLPDALFDGIGSNDFMIYLEGTSMLFLNGPIEIDYPNVSFAWLFGESYDCTFRQEVGAGFVNVFVDSYTTTSSLVSNFVIQPYAVSLVSSGVARSNVPADVLNFFIYPQEFTSVLSVFSRVGTWLSGAVLNISTMFWTAESGMTVLGYLAVASLALAVILLIFYLIAGWLKFH